VPDPALLWKYAYHHGDTVPIWTVYVTGYIGFGLAIGFGEYRLATRHRQQSPRSARATALRFAFGIWVCTMTATMLAEWTKNYVGRLRPNFAERCLGSGAVPPSEGPAGLTRVIHGNAECVNGDLWAGAWDGRRSFPSGHAALAMGAGVYMQLWLIRYSSSTGPASRADEGRRSLLASIGAVLAFAYGLYVSASRVVDNAHHVSDVVGGAGLGAWIAAAHFWRVERETVRAERRICPDGTASDVACCSPDERCAANNGLKTE
jgi:membrane-associated phospholipid phosphatase